MTRRKLLYLKVIAFTVCGVIALGYISDFLSVRICERRIARWISFDIYQGNKFFVLPPSSSYPMLFSPESLRIFKSVGGNVHAYTQTGQYFDGFPWGDVHPATFRYPFIVSVRWGYVDAPLAGEGGTRHFICVLGFIVWSHESGGWIT
jgi:hypothetical protein